MAGVAIHRIIDITGPAFVLRVGLASGMAGDAGENLVIVRIGVAVGAYVVAHTHREIGVVESALVE